MSERYSDGFRTHRREVKAEFRQSGVDVRNYSAVRELLGRIIPDFEDRFSRYDNVFSRWHDVRVQILDLPLGGKDYIQKANELRTNFQSEYDNPKTKGYDPDLWFKISPVLKEITNVVAKGK